MKACDLRRSNEHSYGQVEGASRGPALPVLIFRKGMERSVKTLAMVDTGFDEGLLVSRDVRDVVFAESGSPDDHESLSAGFAEMPCEVYIVSLRVSDRWFSVRAFAPIYGGFETLIGRVVLNNLNLCLRGPAEKACIAAE